MTANLSAALTRQVGAVSERVRTFGDALQRLSDRLSALFPGSSTGEVSAAPSGTGGGLASAAGVVNVFVTNGTDHPVPVTQIGSSGGSGTGAAGGVGSFLGNLFGGLAGAFVGALAAPFLGPIVIGEMIVLVGMAIGLAGEISGVLRVAERIIGAGGIRGIVDALGAIVNNLFTQLTAAGIFPITRLVATVLLLLETAIRIVIYYAGVLINWVVQLLDALNSWLGRFITALGHWVSSLLDNLVVYLGRLWDYLLAIMRQGIIDVMHRVVQGLVEAIGMLVLRLQAVGEFIADAIKFALLEGVNALIGAINRLIDGINAIGGHLGISPMAHLATVANPAPTPLSGRLTAADAAAEALGRSVADRLFPTAGATPTRPTLEVPDFTSPGLHLPAFPEDPGSFLERIFGTSDSATRPSTETATPTDATARSSAASAEPITVAGGIHVTIQTQTLDQNNAEATGRAVAGQIYDELRRLIELERFRHGLPTTHIA
ncbi:MAG TPA: hypothetical protein VFG30_41890 [Polyangiales bacterium]|nr:hypothetical protein [Polyangiales bacterium]